jgi:hypothetical protein
MLNCAESRPAIVSLYVSVWDPSQEILKYNQLMLPANGLFPQCSAYTRLATSPVPCIGFLQFDREIGKSGLVVEKCRTKAGPIALLPRLFGT